MTVIDWVRANPMATLAIALYVFVNLAPRPHPDQASGRLKTLWLVLDRLSLLTTHRVPGRVKMLFAASPPPAATQHATADESDDEEDDDEEGTT